MDQRIYLKVKLKSLAAEAKIIRAEEKKNPKWYNGLYLHRIGVVRPEARATLLAYAFLKGRTYQQVEPTAKTYPDWNRVRKMVEKYGVIKITTPLPMPYTRDELLDHWREEDRLYTEAKENQKLRLTEWIKSANL